MNETEEELNAELNSLMYETKEAEAIYRSELYEEEFISKDDDQILEMIKIKYGICIRGGKVNPFEKSLFDHYKERRFLSKKQVLVYAEMRYKEGTY